MGLKGSIWLEFIDGECLLIMHTNGKLFGCFIFEQGCTAGPNNNPNKAGQFCQSNAKWCIKSLSLPFRKSACLEGADETSGSSFGTVVKFN